MRRNGIGKTPRLFNSGERREHLIGHLLAHVDVFFKVIHDFSGRAICIGAFEVLADHLSHGCHGERFTRINSFNCRTFATLYQHFNGSVGEL